MYGYDAVGSFKRDEYGAMGSGQNFVMPILDNLVRKRFPDWQFKNPSVTSTIKFAQVGHKNRYDEKKPLSLEEAVAIVKDVFIIATERDIYTGDSVEIKVIQRGGITTEVFQLKKD